MAKNTGPVAGVENKSGSVSKTQSIPANVGTPGTSGLSNPTARNASSGYGIKNAGLGFQQDGRMQTDGVDLTTGFRVGGIKQLGVARSVGQATEVAVGPRPK